MNDCKKILKVTICIDDGKKYEEQEKCNQKEAFIYNEILKFLISFAGGMEFLNKGIDKDKICV